MTLTLGPEAQKLIDERMKHGGYATPEDVVLAALALLGQTEDYGDFAPGEWNALLAEAERSGQPVDAERVFDRLRELGAKEGRRAK
jgi:Arc/MetJ-type ribon-helix-helix transcriptional regulator